MLLEYVLHDIVDGCKALYQLVEGLSNYNPISYSVSYLTIVTNWHRISQPLFETPTRHYSRERDSTHDFFPFPPLLDLALLL